MSQSPITDETLARLKREREEADALYNQALTALDRALPASPPAAAAAEDKAGRLAAIVSPDPLAGMSGWRRRIAGFVWRLVGPMLQQQQQFNAAVVERLDAYREARDAVHRAVAAMAAFDAHLLYFAQHITLFVESKDREAVATVHRYLADGLSAVADELAKRWESAVAREQRYEARVSALSETQARDTGEIRTSIASLQQLSHVIKREMERVVAARGAAAVGQPPVGPGLHAGAEPRVSPVGPEAQLWAQPSVGPELQLGALDSYKYVGFEDHFRGSIDEIRSRLADYLPCFEGASDVLDVGCGRGEFLQLLAERGITAWGVDINHEMVENCRARGLEVAEGDALEYLASLPDASLGGLFAAQVVEHLDPDRLMRLLDVAFSKLRPGARIVLETINPACWAAFFDSYIRDLTHVRPVHAETLKYLLQASGFQGVEIRYRAPYADAARLRTVAMPAMSPQPTADEYVRADLAETFNANVEKLNAQMFTHRDYAAVATRA